MTELLVRAALAYLGEPEPLKQRDHLAGFQDRRLRHGSGNANSLNTDEFRLERLVTILEKHRNHFSQVGVEFVETSCLRVCSGEARDISYVQPGVRITLNYRSVLPHG